MDAAALTAIRTAAATVAATLALMEPRSRCLAILGTGEQACSHLHAMLVAHPFERVLVWGRDGERACQFVAELNEPRVELVLRAEDAVRAADVICTVTASPLPIVLGEWLRAGQHVNLVGASFAEAREIDDLGIKRSRYFVDSRASAMSQAGELLHAIQTGQVTVDHIVGEIGEVHAGNIRGRVSDSDLTVYKSLGVAAQDLAAATHVLKAAQQRHVGTVASL